MPGKFDKGSTSGGILSRAIDKIDNLRKSRDGGNGFNGFLSLGKKQTGNTGDKNIFGIRIGQEPAD